MKTKAIRLHGEDDLRLDEFELPEPADVTLHLFRFNAGTGHRSSERSRALFFTLILPGNAQPGDDRCRRPWHHEQP